MLEVLANDELKVSERNHNHSKKYTNLCDELDKLENKLADKLDQEGKDLLEEYIGKQLDKISIIRVEEFVYGYQIGSLIMMDIYSILKR